MDNDIVQQFENNEFGQLRIIKNENDQLMFCAKDVANALGYANTNDAINKHCKGVAKRYPLKTKGGIQNIRFITEGDMYRLIVGSKLEGAQRFESWVFDDVLPTIHKHGLYATPQTVEQMLADPDTMIQALEALKAEREKSKRLEELNGKLKVKADYFDDVMDGDGLLSVRDAAKLLKSYDKSIGQKRLFAFLREDGMLEKRTRHTTAKAIERGYMRERPFKIPGTDGKPDRMDYYGCLTPKGVAWCLERYCSETK